MHKNTVKVIPLAKRKYHASPVAPLDFYRFRHREEKVSVPKRKSVITRSLWIVGVSPFDHIISDDAGHVVHLAAPRFTARWSMNDGTIAQIAQPDFFDEDLNIIIYETLLMENATEPLGPWLLEAVCAVAFSKGIIAVSDPEELH